MAQSEFPYWNEHHRNPTEGGRFALPPFRVVVVVRASLRNSSETACRATGRQRRHETKAFYATGGEGKRKLC